MPFLPPNQQRQSIEGTNIQEAYKQGKYRQQWWLEGGHIPRTCCSRAVMRVTACCRTPSLVCGFSACSCNAIIRPSSLNASFISRTRTLHDHTKPILLLFYPSTQFLGNEKNYAMQYKKYKNQAGMNLTPPPPSQNCHVVRWHCSAESECRVIEIIRFIIIIIYIFIYAPEVCKDLICIRIYSALWCD